MPSLNLISFFPSNDIADHLSKYKNLRIFVDIKNCMTSLFIREVCEDLVTVSKNADHIDSSVFQSLLNYAIYWKKFQKRFGINISIYFFMDTGKSSYHTEIERDYKESRLLNDQILEGADDNRRKIIINRNFDIAENVLNALPNIYFFRLRFLESDFVPHYLIYHRLPGEEPRVDEETFNLIVSSDKDMYQTLKGPNCGMIYRSNTGKKKFVTNQNFFLNYIKVNDNDPVDHKYIKMLQQISPDLVDVCMSLVGDAVDDIKGVPGIGPRTSLKILTNPEFHRACGGSIDQVRTRIQSGGKFFSPSVVEEVKKNNSNMDKLVKKCILYNDVVTRSFRLISYDALIRWLLSGNELRKLDWIRYMDKVLNKQIAKPIQSAKILYIALQQGLFDNCLSEKDVELLF